PLAAGQPLYIAQSGTCAVVGQFGGKWRAAAEIQLDTLVSGTARIDASAGRVVAASIVGSDGSQQTYGSDAWDSTRGERVPSGGGAGVPRWLPAQPARADYFSAAACPALVAQAACWSFPPKEALQPASTGTPDPASSSSSDYFDLGALVGDATPIYGLS